MTFTDQPLLGYWVAVAGLLAVTPSLFIADVREHRLPNRLTGPAALWMGVAATVGAVAARSWQPLAMSLAAGIASLLVYLALYVLARGGFGMGDVKLGGVLGLALGLQSPVSAIAAFVVGFLVAGLWAALLIATRKAGLRTHIAFGPFMLIGAWVVILGFGTVERALLGSLLLG